MKEKEAEEKKANDRANEILRGMKSGQFDIDSYTKSAKSDGGPKKETKKSSKLFTKKFSKKKMLKFLKDCPSCSKKELEEFEAKKAAKPVKKEKVKDLIFKKQ